MARLRDAEPAGDLPAVLLPPVVADWVDPAEFSDVVDDVERLKVMRQEAWRRWHAARIEWAQVHGGLSAIELRRRFSPEQIARAVVAERLLT